MNSIKKQGITNKLNSALTTGILAKSLLGVALATGLLAQSIAFAEPANIEPTKKSPETTQIASSKEDVGAIAENKKETSEKVVKKHNKHDILKTMFLDRRPYTH